MGEDARGPWKRLLSWVSDEVQTVPDDVSQCEYDCDKPTCSAEEWATCENRLAKMKTLKFSFFPPGEHRRR